MEAHILGPNVVNPATPSARKVLTLITADTQAWLAEICFGHAGQRAIAIWIAVAFVYAIDSLMNSIS